MRCNNSFLVKSLAIVVLLRLCEPACRADPHEAETIAGVMQKAEQNAGFSGIVLAEVSGKVIAVVAVGSRDGNPEHPITDRTLFELASVTKPITAATCLLLEQQGRLRFDDSMSIYLPTVPADYRAITVQHLLQHTSGVSPTNPGKGGPKVPPGTHFEYWNQGYCLLSMVIAKSSGKVYTDAVRDLVYLPAGMQTACFTGDTNENGAQVAIGRSDSWENRSALEPPYGKAYGLEYQGTGGAVASIHDVHKFVQAIRGDQLLDETRRKKLLTTGPTNYAIGWSVQQVGDGQRRIHHSGSVRGFLASVSWYPEDNCSLILLSNSDRKQTFFEVEKSLLSILERQFIRTPEEQRFTGRERQAVAGEYSGSIPNGRMLTITIVEGAGDKLIVSIDWGDGLKSQGVLVKRGKDQLSLLEATGTLVPLDTHSIDGKPVDRILMLDSEFMRK